MSAAKAQSLQISQDMAFQRLSWRVQRLGWIIMGLLLVAALVGVFGSGGPLSHSTAGTSGLSVHYQRFARLLGSAEYQLTVPAPQAGLLRLWIDRETLRHIELSTVTPAPQSVQVAQGKVVYSFAAVADGGPLLLTFQGRFSHMGKLRTRMGLVEGPTVEFAQWVYP